MNTKWIIPLLVPSLFIFFNACNKSDAVDQTEVNPTFELLPPIADDVLVKKIPGDNEHLIVLAKFDKDCFKKRYLAVNVNNKKIILRDDGKEVDSLAGDAVFSVKMEIDTSNLKKLLRNKNALQSSQPQFIYNARSIAGKTAIAGIDADKFNRCLALSIKNIVTTPPEKLKDHSLLITNLAVTEDETRTWNVCRHKGKVDGPWTFKTLMKHLSSANQEYLIDDNALSDFVESWLMNWLTSDNVINGENVPARAAMNSIIMKWKAESQALPAPNVPIGKLDMRAAPFKLTAIVNRLDLRGNTGYGISNAGRGSFIFCLIQNCIASEFNIIFEYDIPIRSRDSLNAFAKQWYDLKDLDFSNPLYRERLQNITDRFTTCGRGSLKPDKNPFRCLRTNEAILSCTRELREFKLDSQLHKLRETTVEKEPATKYNAKTTNADVERLAKFINENESLILQNKYTVPETFDYNNFLAAHSIIELPGTGNPAATSLHHWDGTTIQNNSFITNANARQAFSLQTCSGCHSGETQTFFTMVDPVAFGTEATLSGFLTGKQGRGNPINLSWETVYSDFIEVPDPAGRNSSVKNRRFNDLKRRAIDLTNMVVQNSNDVLHLRNILLTDPIRFVH